MRKYAIIQDNKIFIYDERWITINADPYQPGQGKHVLIKENGDIIAGLGGKFKNLKDLGNNPKIKGVASIKKDRICFTNTNKMRDAIIYILDDGKRIIFPKKYNPADQTMTIEKAVELWQKVPEYIRKLSQDNIEIVDYENPQDAYWRKKYKYFSRSYMTGGESNITVYQCPYPHDENWFVQSLCHEIGHKFDRTAGRERGGSGTRISERALWKNAIKKDGSYPSRYAQVHVNEDFAESVRLYAMDTEYFRSSFPNRTKVLDKILNKGAKK